MSGDIPLPCRSAIAWCVHWLSGPGSCSVTVATTPAQQPSSSTCGTARRVSSASPSSRAITNRGRANCHRHRMQPPSGWPAYLYAAARGSCAGQHDPGSATPASEPRTAAAPTAAASPAPRLPCISSASGLPLWVIPQQHPPKQESIEFRLPVTTCLPWPSHCDQDQPDSPRSNPASYLTRDATVSVSRDLADLSPSMGATP